MGNAGAGHAESGVHRHVQPVGTEGDMDFAGRIAGNSPSGAVLKKVDDTEQLLTCDIDLAEASSLRKKIPYLATRRPECYL